MKVLIYVFYTVSCTATAGRHGLGIRDGQTEAFAHVERQCEYGIDRLELRLVAEQREAGDAWKGSERNTKREGEENVKDGVQDWNENVEE